MTLSVADRFALALTDSLLELNRLALPSRVRVQSMLRQLELRVARAIRDAEIDEAVGPNGRRQRTERAIKAIQKDIAATYKEIGKVSRKGIAAALAKTAKDATKATKGLLKKSKKIDAAKRKDLLRNDTVLGDTLEAWLRQQADNLAKKIARELRVALRTGEGPDGMLKRIRGERSGRSIAVTLSTGKKRRIIEYRGGLLDAARTAMDALLRTAVSSMAQTAWLAAHEGNQDVIGYAAVTVLDERTSRICMARTGAMWFVDGRPMPQSTRQEPFPGPPPWHFHCRSSLVPITEKNAGRLKVTTFDDWLEQRGDDFARAKLGPGLFDLWRSGKITLSQLVDQAGDYRTLPELAKNPRKP